MDESHQSVDDRVVIDGVSYNRLLLKQIARDIVTAHDVNPNSWCIITAEGTPFLSIASVTVGHPAYGDRAFIMVDVDGMTDEQLEWCQARFDDGRTLTSNPSFRRVLVAEQEISHAIELLALPHQRLIEQLSESVQSRPVQWKNHRDDFRQGWNAALGVDIPEPGYLHDIPNTAANPSQVTKSIQLSDWDARLLHLIVDDISLAHSINPKSWALYMAKGGILTLAVGNLAVLWLVRDDNGFWLKGDLDDPRFNSLREKQFKTLSFDPSGGFKVSGMTPNVCIHQIQEFSSEHSSSVVELAKNVRTHTHYHRFHRPHLVKELAQALGVQLPSPTYPITTNEALSSTEEPENSRYWKVSPGSNAAFWEEFQTLSAIAVHWVDDLADLSELPEDKNEFASAVAAYPGATPHAARALWGFREDINIGDQVLAYGNRTILGYGTITGGYQAVHDDFRYNHRRSVEWKFVGARTVDSLPEPLQHKLARNSTIVELTRQEFAQAIGQMTSLPVDPLPAIRGQFAASGLHYTDAQIATFYTSLQTKGFVVLSGISGTGKSKIGTGFVEMLPASSVQPVPSPDTAGMIPITVKPYMRTYKRAILPKFQVDLLPPLEVGQQVEIHIALDGIEGMGRLEHRANSGDSSITVLYFKGEIGKAFASLELGIKLYLRPILDDDGNSIERLELLREEEAAAATPSPLEEASPTQDHLFLSVRPDWRDSTSLLGYYNPLTQTYEWTEFLHFLLRAQKSYETRDGLAWFVILDEMNLAHVEYYFADLLSVIESGRDDEGWTKEPLRLTYPDTLEDEAPPSEIHLPPNLYIIGTVNMDETTHAFSPKVLDRAFTIELTEVDFSDYPPPNLDPGVASLTDDQKSVLLRAFTRDGRFAVIDKKEIAQAVADHSRIRTDLQALNGLLQPHRMHFGYRVFDEICQYLHNNDLNGMMGFDEAFDQAVFMKVLPKFTGSRARLQSPLHGVLAWAIDPGKTSRDDVSAVTAQFNAYHAGTAIEVWTAEPAFPTVAGRVRDMLVALERAGFVSFG